MDEFSEIFERLAQKHGRELPDFKLRVWARMLANKVWSSEEECPQHSFFIGKKSKNQLQKPAAQTTVQTHNKVQLRGEILKQLRELKDLKDADVLDSTQFESQKKLLLMVLNELH